MSKKTIKKILITGANGFIGNTLMRYYQNNDQAVVGVDLVGNGSEIIKGDIIKKSITLFLERQFFNLNSFWIKYINPYRAIAIKEKFRNPK